MSRAGFRRPPDIPFNRTRHDRGWALHRTPLLLPVMAAVSGARRLQGTGLERAVRWADKGM